MTCSKTLSRCCPIFFACLSLALAACASDPNKIEGISGEEAMKMNASRSKFDSVKDTPLTANTRFAAGELAESQNAPAAAIIQYKEALKIDPKHQGALYRLAVVYTQLKQYPDAIDTWKSYVKATDESANAYSNLAFCQELAGHTADAENSYKKGIAADPKNQPCRVNYGLMLGRHGQYSQAVQQWQVVLTPAEVHYNLGSIYELDGRTAQAKAEYQKALELNPKLSDAQSRLAALDLN